ncbi:MAG: hypothetical protein AABZ74_13170 [Cyanobacteriota bacterium]
MSTMKNLHIPLPIQWYEKLKEFSNVNEISATEIVRNAVIDFLKAQEKKSIDNAILQFASEYGGSEFDLDKDLEDSSLELLLRE